MENQKILSNDNNFKDTPKQTTMAMIFSLIKDHTTQWKEYMYTAKIHNITNNIQLILMNPYSSEMSSDNQDYLCLAYQKRIGGYSKITFSISRWLLNRMNSILYFKNVANLSNQTLVYFFCAMIPNFNVVSFYLQIMKFV